MKGLVLRWIIKGHEGRYYVWYVLTRHKSLQAPRREYHHPSLQTNKDRLAPPRHEDLQPLSESVRLKLESLGERCVRLAS